jgi:ATP-dependent helicase/nuclease subunit A
MRTRLNDWLTEYGAPDCPDETRLQALIDRGMSPAQAPSLVEPLATLHRRLLESGRPVEIRTFHAWFAQLLRAAPLDLLAELGMQPDLELIEALDDHLDEVHRRFHAALLRDDTLRAEHAALVAQRGRSQARKWLDTVLNRRVEVELADEAGTLEGSVPPASALWPALNGLDHPAQQLTSGAGTEALRLAAAALGTGTKTQRTAAEKLVAAMEASEQNERLALAWDALFTNKGTPRKLGDDASVAALQDLLQQLTDQVAQHEAHLEHRRMVRLSRLLLAEYATYKRQRGLADMADLERCALALLRDSSLSGWVQERLDARIRHVLIDEFQDTSPLQWHALHAWLSAYAGAGGGASGQKPPSVFIVGDPKQSIYRFRRAEPRVFEAASRFVAQALDGCLLAFDHTRRNAPPVLAALNAVFERAQAAGEFDGFRPHTTEVGATAGGAGAASVDALPQVLRPPWVTRAAAGAEAETDAGTETAAEAPLVWRDSLTQPRHEPDEVLREREATLVADAIQSLVAAGQVTPGEVLVLCRKRESLRTRCWPRRRRRSTSSRCWMCWPHPATASRWRVPCAARCSA